MAQRPPPVPSGSGSGSRFYKGSTPLNNRKIVVIGSDVGADLALVASGKFPEVRTIVAINPKLAESVALAGSSQDFAPRSTLIVTADQTEAAKFKPLLKQPYDVQIRDIQAGTSAWIGNSTVTDAIFQ